MGGTASKENTNTHVANGTGVPLRVFYSTVAMELSEMVVQEGAGGEASRASTFRSPSHVSYIHVPAKSVGLIKGEGVLYVSIFVERCLHGDTCEKIIALNYRINWDRSIIVTRDHQIKYQKYNASYWEDENGIIHRP